MMIVCQGASLHVLSGYREYHLSLSGAADLLFQEEDGERGCSKKELASNGQPSRQFRHSDYGAHPPSGAGLHTEQFAPSAFSNHTFGRAAQSRAGRRANNKAPERAGVYPARAEAAGMVGARLAAGR